MRVEKYVEIETHVYVDISVEDIAETIAMLPDATSEVITLISNFAQVAKAIDDNLIENMRPEQKKVIREFFANFSERFNRG